MTINCKGNLIDINSPKIMGILNITPDSFYDGGKYNDGKNICSQVENMITEGATFIDVGAYSSRPGAEHISEDEELQRIIPIVELLIKTFPDIILSIDTFRSKVASLCIDAGAALINDISAGVLDSNMLQTIASKQVPYIMMHMKGTPQNMVTKNIYNNLIEDIIFYFSERIEAARKHGIIDVVIDPGFGFAKNIEQNFELLNNMQLFKTLELPLLIGVSRKSMIYKTLKSTPNEALNGTTVLNTIALQKGANILRVHDVKEAMECITLTNQLNS